MLQGSIQRAQKVLNAQRSAQIGIRDFVSVCPCSPTVVYAELHMLCSHRPALSPAVTTVCDLL